MKIPTLAKPVFALLPLSLLVACAGQQKNDVELTSTPMPEQEIVVPVMTPAESFLPTEQSEDANYVQIENEPETDIEENFSQKEENTDVETTLATNETEAEATSTLIKTEENALSNPEESDMTTLVIETPEQLALDAYHAANDEISADANDDQLPGDEKFFFGFDKKTLAADEIEKITEKGKILALNPQMKVVINGHTDSRGDKTYNQSLSIERAEFVANLLKAAGASGSQIEIHGWGSEQPMVSDATYQENRRVELIFESLHYAINE